MAAPAMELAEAHMRGLLASLGLDVEYIRGEGDTLYFRDRDGDEVPVLDLVGGYGSLIFGHNHPALVAKARELLADRVPVHAQFSYHPYANELANALNAVLHREFGVREPYSAVFANSGAEGVEIAMKHAELDRVIRAGE
ncbi:aminotransferase class III-fold pyridoxal phosphate-dependent enzyme, partial [Actinokineospora pegani]|uniref:aminotransferase class III-fold pyridoxal phosphate-dependent enzyme n=1 Tax=Actinokineospora pegani TaxID=2654637 RepID=UPI0012EAC486